MSQVIYYVLVISVLRKTLQSYIICNICKYNWKKIEEEMGYK